ncbi:MAG TPA: DUF4159 domain-containing protein [Candidatus Limnocylindrales bacterium]|nr:DUF4159 domain-containing protein [Candidatus Limnocylindrales bacterium]
MIFHRLPAVIGCGIVLIGAVYAFQKPFRVYPSYERQDDIPLPPDYQEKTEWVFARLMYPNHPNSLLGGRRRFFGFGGEGGGYDQDWRQGGTSWTQDYPRADRHFAAAVRRLTRVNVRSVEQPVSPDDLDDFYNWPWMNAGEMGDWKLTDPQVKVLREYLLRGGFLMLDDFWGAEEYGRFAETMNKVFPDHPVVEMPSADPIFHCVYDLDDRYQVLGQWSLRPYGPMSQRAVGTVAHWYGIYDDKGRVMVAICFNSDIGDSWEWADDPRYPEKFSALGIRIGINYVIYSMTH